MKTTGVGFKHFLNGVQLKDYDSFQKAIKNIEVKTDVIGLELHAKTNEVNLKKMFKYFIENKEVNKADFQNKVGDYITVLSGDTISSTLFNSFFAENKDNNKSINRNNPMELNEHLNEVVNRVKLEDRIVEFDGMEYYAVGMGFLPKKREGEKEPNSLVDLIEIIKQREIAKEFKKDAIDKLNLSNAVTNVSQGGFCKTEDLFKIIKERNELNDYKKEVCNNLLFSLSKEEIHQIADFESRVEIDNFTSKKL